jgi:hypothetical protein
MSDRYEDLIDIPVTPALRGSLSAADRYPATRFLVSVIRVIGLATLVFGVGGGLLGAFLGELSMVYGLVVALGAFIYFVICFASAEGLKVIVDMESHQRAIRTVLERSNPA